MKDLNGHHLYWEKQMPSWLQSHIFLIFNQFEDMPQISNIKENLISVDWAYKINCIFSFYVFIFSQRTNTMMCHRLLHPLIWWVHISYGTTLDLTLFSAARLRVQQSNYKNQKEGKALSFTAWGTKRPKFPAKRSFCTLKITWDWFSDHQKHERLFFLQKVTRSWLVGHWSNHRKLSKRCKAEKVTFCKRS